MDKWFQEFKYTVVNYKLDLCCWLLPMRVGCLVTAVFNIITDFISMVGIANEGFSPTITKVQEALIEDYVTKPPTLLAYTMELAMNVIFLCAIYRRDVILLRVFLYYSMIALFISILVYSVIIAAVPLELAVVIIIGPLFQAYTILLVRSYIVEIKLENKKYELPTLVMSTLREKGPNNFNDQDGKPDNKEVIVVIPDVKEKEDKEMVKADISEIKIIEPTQKHKEVNDEPKRIFEFKKVDRKFFEIKKDEPKVYEKGIDVPKIEVKGKEIAKIGTKVTKINDKGIKTEDDKKTEEELKDVKRGKDLKDNKKGKDSKDDKKGKDSKDDQKGKDSKEVKKDKDSKDDQKDKEIESTKEKKPIRSIQSIFSRRNKKKINDEKAESETSELKDKLATVEEHPKE